MSPARPLSYYIWPISIASFFLLLAVGNVLLYRLANDAHEGSQLIERSAYERGIDYQQKLDALQRFRNSGIRAEFMLPGVGPDTSLEIRLTDQHGDPIRGKNLRVKAVYAAAAEYDQNLVFTERGHVPGLYEATFRPAPGIFLLTLEFENERNERLIFESRLLG